MKTLSSAFIFASLLLAPFAHGEELISSKVSVAPLPMWTGFYAGLNAGSFWNNPVASPDWSRVTTPGAFAYSTAFASAPQMGFAWTAGPHFAGGGQVGYNWQVSDKIVVGVETDFQGVAGGGTNWNTGWISSSSTNRGPSSIGSVRGRAGYLVTPDLQVYGTGGFSYSGAN
jgi:outer membrane immunogenic protein